MSVDAAAMSLIELALKEDIATGDITSLATIPDSCMLEAVIIARQELVVCGLAVAEQVFASVDSELSFVAEVEDGVTASPEQVLCRVKGAGKSILSAERTALNFMQRLSGIATLTAEMKQRAANSDVLLRDTRKTTPGWRALEKYAVSVGGGSNHRMGLFDAFLIKNNHVDAVGGDIAETIRRCRAMGVAGAKLQVEVRDDHFHVAVVV